MHPEERNRVFGVDLLAIFMIFS